MPAPIRPLPIVFCSLLLLVLSGCEQHAGQTPALGQAFVGAITLTVRKDLAPTAPVVATLSHGEKLNVLQVRRRFIRVRTVKGAEGWVDGRNLFSVQQMSELRKLAANTSQLPSQGKAKTFELLNMHSEPSRTSPTFNQLAEGTLVDVIGAEVAPRQAADASQPALVFPTAAPPPKPRSKKAAREAKEKEKTSRLVLPPPPAPKVPENWLELSRTPLSEPDPAEKPIQIEAQVKPVRVTPSKAVKEPPKLEDWSLVRAKDGKVGWVLSRLLVLAIPDDVAQYAEGHRITTYFPLGEVEDEQKGKKYNWLWTTSKLAAQPYQFDRMRVFLWNRRRHRYETSYKEYDIVGYMPVEVKPCTIGARPNCEFALTMETEEGKLVRKHYAFDGTRTTRLGVEDVPDRGKASLLARVSEGPLLPAGQGEPETSAPPATQQGWLAGLSERFQSLKNQIRHK